MRSARQRGDGRFHRRALISRFGFTVGVAASFAAPVVAGSWQTIDGAAASDPRFPRVRAAADAALRVAATRLWDEWGLRAGGLPVVWTLDGRAARVIAAEATAPGSSTGRHGFELGRTEFGELAGRAAVVVTLPAHRFLARPRAIAAVVLHEAVHAAHASVAGSRARYDRVPRWFREGVALLIANEGPRRVRERIAHTVHGGRPADGFFSSPRVAEFPALPAATTYAECYLRVSALRQQLEALRFGELVRAVVRGAAFESELTRATGRTLVDVYATGGEFARVHVRELLPERRGAELAEALDKRRTVSPAQRIAALERLLGSSPSGPLGGTLRYAIAKAALTARDAALAVRGEKQLAALLESKDDLWRPEATLLLGHYHARRGDARAARAQWLEVRTVFGDDRELREEAERLLLRAE